MSFSRPTVPVPLSFEDRAHHLCNQPLMHSLKKTLMSAQLFESPQLLPRRNRAILDPIVRSQ
ncbi:hypothetical protein Tcan_11443 [Toxocara canis]|uniref:Uncharacterized protein n=1 Tax=Toxocara canis TaxID=6265 RepID=A0A0B2VTH3_TOXCA|nr:hypothetical protein Tcan_11443 [Toxocara canis]